MTVCERCLTAIQKLRPQGSPLPQENTVSVTIPKLRRSDVPACWICCKFSWWLENEYYDLFKTWLGKPLEITFATFGRIGFVTPPDGNFLLPFFMEIYPSSQESDGSVCEIELNFILAQDMTQPIVQEPKRYGIASIDLSQVQTWIDKCIKSHKKCRNGTPDPWFPTRLLHLESQGQKARLIISKESPPDSHYMTLSHRWGQQSYTKLETSTMAQLQENIDITGLPVIFQDTIKVAHQLGIHYLWIDALCIKQGQEDLSDWQSESLNMEKVYSCAFLNVSATLSRDGTESLFQERFWITIQPSEIRLEVKGTLLNYYIVDGDVWSDEVVNAPLNQRGWVFQERFLARRVLHFGQHQLGWECLELNALEMFPYGLPKSSAMSLATKPNTHATTSALSQPSSESPDTAFITQWHEIVNRYSKCKLTYSKDKTIALSGVAKRISSTRTDQYFAGMWRSILVYSLAWWRSSTDCIAFPINLTFFRAPSWSWASADGEINFPTIQGGVSETFADIERIIDPIMDENNCVTNSASIRAKGVCFSLSIEWLNKNEIHYFQVLGFRFFISDLGDLSNLDTDVDDISINLEASAQEVQEAARRGHLMLMPLFASAYFFYAIVLVKVRGVGAHRRIGAVEIGIWKDNYSHRNAPDAPDAPDAEMAGSLANPLMREVAVSQGIEGSVVCNRTAVNFIQAINKLQRSSRIICIC